MRLLAIALALTGQVAQSETLFGRKVVITDGRTSSNAPAPLVVAMHGFLGSASNMRRKTRFDAIARREGFLVLYPNGLRRRWNDGRSPANRVDDVGYLSSVVQSLIADGRADPRQIFFTGHSNGGGMAMRMACDRPDLVRGIAVVATKTALNYQCPNGAPVPALFIHGTQDPISPHQGRSGDSRLGGALSSAATFDLWRKRNRCSGNARTSTIDRQDDGTSVEVKQYASCTRPFVSIVINGHGHDWPSRTGKKTRLQGPASKEVEGASVVWRFFKSQL